MIKSLSRVQNRLVGISSELSTCSSLSPSPTVDALFNELVSLVLAYRLDAEAVLSDASLSECVPILQSLSARGEAALETYWSQRIVLSASPVTSLMEFPYYENYELLLHKEREALAYAPIETHSKVLFVGGGPLPLSAILLARHAGISVTCLDIDTTATCLAEQLISALSLSSSITCVSGTVGELAEWRTYTHVMVAALAGVNAEEKLQIARGIAERALPGTPVVWRGADALGVLLYSSLPRALRAYLAPKQHVSSQSPVINTIDVFGVRLHSKYCTASQWEAVGQLLAQYEAYTAAVTPLEKSRIGDSMFYDDPVIWILYKLLAYHGTTSAIATLGDLRHHAADEQDICGRRLKFLLASVGATLAVDLSDKSMYPDDMLLTEFVDSQVLSEAVRSKEIMNEWRRQEYCRDTEGRVAKWQAAIS
jgi:nicotianamine synthase